MRSPLRREEPLAPHRRRKVRFIARNGEDKAMTVSRDPVTTTPRRRRIPDADIQRFVDRIAERFRPRRIILFGSYARGAPRPESDVDLLVLMDTAAEGEESLRIRQAVPCDFGVDLIVRTPETFQRRLELGDFFLREIAEQGKVLYESPNR